MITMRNLASEGCFSILCLIALNACHPKTQNTSTSKEVHFKKTTLSNEFIAEGAAVADVNHDGKTDILSGTYWFEAPNWTKHELQPGQTFDPKEYSSTFMNFTLDVNQDGWTDLLQVPTPGGEGFWYENPKNAGGFWKKHNWFHAIGNESPAIIDLDGDGLMDLVCADSKNKKVVWVSSPAKGDTNWVTHIISNDSVIGTHMYTHGLGFGDMNGDGRKDVVIREGWWEAPTDRKQENWTFHPGKISEECSQMYPMDLDGDGDMDIISASAHNYGIWWSEQVKQGDSVSWVHHDIYNKFSQTHGMGLADINGDGYPDLITGKRFYAHYLNDPGSAEPAVIYWFEYKPGKTPTWIPHEIDNNSGSGLQVVIEDMNKDKLPDIVIGNKKGVFYFEQTR